MSKDISQALARIKKQAIHLNDLTDRGAVAVKQVEDYLNGCNLGIEAYLRLSESEDHDSGYATWENFAYCRVGQKFRVAYSTGDNSGPDSSSVKPWADCSREIKLQTLPRLPELLQKIAEEAEKRTKTAEHAISSVAELLAPTGAEDESESSKSPRRKVLAPQPSAGQTEAAVTNSQPPKKGV